MTTTSSHSAPCFIVGMSRAGTTWMSRALNEHTQVASFGESLFWGRGHTPPGDDGHYSVAQVHALGERLARTRWGPFGNTPGALQSVGASGADGALHARIRSAFAAVDAPMTPADCFALLCDIVCEAEGKPVVVEKTPHHLNWTDRILRAFPEARFIVMLREPYGFMRSYKHQGDRKATSTRRAFERRYHPAACALVWRGYQLAAAALAQRAPNQTLILNLEDVQRDEAGALARVQQLLGIPAETLAGRVPADNTSFPSGAAPELDAADIFWMNRIAGRVMRRQGYALRRTPFAPWPVLRSVLRLPWWTAWNLYDMRRRTAGSLTGYLYRWLRPGR